MFINSIFVYVIVISIAPGDWNDRFNIKAKWSESTDWSHFSPVTSKSFLVISRSNVFPAVCVGIVTCCDNSYWLSKALNSFAPESNWLFTWKLKSPTIKCFSVVDCKWHRISLNSAWKTVVKFPVGLYAVIPVKHGNQRRDLQFGVQMMDISHILSRVRRESRHVTATPPLLDDLWVWTVA